MLSLEHGVAVLRTEKVSDCASWSGTDDRAWAVKEGSVRERSDGIWMGRAQGVLVRGP